MTENVPAWVTILTKLFLLPSNYKQKKKSLKITYVMHSQFLQKKVKKMNEEYGEIISYFLQL